MASIFKQLQRKKLLRRWHLWRPRPPQGGEIDDYGMRIWLEWAKHAVEGQVSEESLQIELRRLRAGMEAVIRRLELIERRALTQEGYLGQQATSRPAAQERPAPQQRPPETDPA